MASSQGRWRSTYRSVHVHRRVSTRLAHRLAALMVAGAALAVAVPAAADRTAADPIEDARAELDAARATASEAARRYDSTLAERARVEAEIASITETIPRLRTREAELQAIIADRAAALYRNSDAGNVLEVTAGSDTVFHAPLVSSVPSFCPSSVPGWPPESE